MLRLSLPSWECGLKFNFGWNENGTFSSLPSWECGLKFFVIITQKTYWQRHSLRGSVDWNFYRSMMGYKLTPSLPSWECGLKYNSNKQRDRRSEVTPFVGVWIEILNWRNIQRCKLVTPFVGVWIEICEPSHACELNLVTPFVGVWIEIPFIY